MLRRQYVVVTRGPYGVYVNAHSWKFCHVKSALSTVVSPTWLVTRIPSLVLCNTWRLRRTKILNIPKFVLYVAHTRRLYAKVWPRRWSLNVRDGLLRGGVTAALHMAMRWSWRRAALVSGHELMTHLFVFVHAITSLPQAWWTKQRTMLKPHRGK